MNHVVLIAVLLLTVGCSTQKATRRVVIAPVVGTTLSLNEVESLRSGEVVKKYYVGSYVDPSHSNIRHDPHMIERIEEKSRWNLRPNVPVVASGPTYKAVEDNALKNAMQQQYDHTINKERSINAEVQHQTAELKKEIMELKSKLLSQGENDFKRMEEKIEALNTKIASLESSSKSQQRVVGDQEAVQQKAGTSKEIKSWQNPIE